MDSLQRKSEKMVETRCDPLPPKSKIRSEAEVREDIARYREFVDTLNRSSDEPEVQSLRRA